MSDAVFAGLRHFSFKLCAFHWVNTHFHLVTSHFLLVSCHCHAPFLPCSLMLFMRCDSTDRDARTLFLADHPGTAWSLFSNVAVELQISLHALGQLQSTVVGFPFPYILVIQSIFWFHFLVASLARESALRSVLFMPEYFGFSRGTSVSDFW